MAETTTTEGQYQVGDKVEYRPVGGGRDNVSHSVGEIVDVQESGTGFKYFIKNDNTARTTAYQGKNIVKKLESKERE